MNALIVTKIASQRRSLFFFQDVLKECRKEWVKVDTDSQEQKDIVNERTQHTEVRFEHICRLVSFVGDICSFLSVNACIISLVNL